MSKAQKLRALLKEKPIIKVMGAHNGLGAKLIERHHFDAIWASGLEISTSHGVPDANILTMTDNLIVSQEINDATELPVICDCDTGYGNASNVKYMVKKYEAAGMAAVIIEDKLFPKVNSFIPGRQELASIDEFVGKIKAAKSAQRDPDFMVIARVEALIAGWGLHEALKRAYAYAEAGADGVVVHSKKDTPEEMYAFTKEWKGTVPLVAIPTTYNKVTADELAEHGYKVAIYANHGLRASFAAMDSVFKEIAQQGTTSHIESRIASLKDIFEIQGMYAMKEDEKKFVFKDRIHAIIPAAKDHRSQPDLDPLLSDKPLCMLNVGGKPLLERQVELLRSSGVSDVAVVTGFQADKIKIPNVNLLYNDKHKTCHSAYSVMAGRDFLKRKTLVVYSDILFDQQILKRLLDSPYQITLVIDRAYQTLPHRDKKLDLVAAKSEASQGGRKLTLDAFKPIERIGKLIPQENANYEFIGMAFFRDEGAKALIETWEDANQKFKDRPFYESPSIDRAGFNDLIQYLIDRHYPIYGMEVEHGWSEIHSLEDYERVDSYFKGRPPHKGL